MESRRLVTEAVKTAMSALQKAENRMFEVAGQLGMDGNRVVQVGSYGQKIDCSQKEGLDAFGGWVARTPAEITAEHFYLGKPKHYLLWESRKKLLYSVAIKFTPDPIIC